MIGISYNPMFAVVAFFNEYSTSIVAISRQFVFIVDIIFAPFFSILLKKICKQYCLEKNNQIYRGFSCHAFLIISLVTLLDNQLKHCREGLVFKEVSSIERFVNALGKFLLVDSVLHFQTQFV